MEQNYLENWINSDKKLSELIKKIESTDKTLTEKAEIVFEKLCVLYEIPRMPTDIKEDEFDNGDDFDGVTNHRSLFEEHALIRYISDKNEDPIGIKGEGYSGEVVFPQKESISWFDLGCKIMVQIN